MTNVIESNEIYKNLSLENIEGEIWKDIIGFEGYYQVSNMGRIKSLAKIVKHSNPKLKCSRKERILKQNKVIGYLSVCFSKNGVATKPFLVHRIVGEHFIDNPYNKPCINHKNGIRHDNRATELEWCTHSENSQHAIDTGLHKVMIGEDVNGVKLSEGDVFEIRRMVEIGLTQKEIGLVFNVNASTISDIKTKTTWRHI